MTNKLNTHFDIQNSYLRSTNLDRDFLDPSSLENYVLTEHAVDCIKRIYTGCNTNSSQRAWRITGDYGSGKSSFALFLAHWLSGKAESFPSRIQSTLKSSNCLNKENNYEPVLVTGTREPLSKVILGAILKSLATVKKKCALKSEIATALGNSQITDSDVVNLLKKYNSYICQQGKSGLILIIDEMGKFLEYIAMHPEKQDIYLLQKLAELAARSKDKPIFFVGILHQGFSAYADGLNSKSAHEWEKVGGRFDELFFNQPIEQIVTLIASALGIKESKIDLSIRDKFGVWLERLLELRWFGNAASKKLVELANSFYPLHPVVIPVLTEVLHRYGQNERSLFSFLLSNERFGLQDVSRERCVDQPYRLHDLYDYIKANFSHKLHSHKYRNNWNVISSIVEGFDGDSEIDLKVLKTIGLLNLLNDNRYKASNEVIKLCLDQVSQDRCQKVAVSIDKLLATHLLHRRGISGGLCLWSHTSVNLDEAEQLARAEIGSHINVIEYIKQNKKLSPIVARRHYIETGNLRAFNVSYCLVSEIKTVAKKLEENIEGQIFIPLCETQSEYNGVIELTSKATNCTDNRILWAVPKPLTYLTQLVKDVMCWEHIKNNTAELNSDRYANEAVNAQLNELNEQLQKRLNSFVNLKTVANGSDLKWFSCGAPIAIKTGKALLSFLSQRFDVIYKEAPKVKNELINRTSISAAAAAARLKLITAMFNNSSELELGLDPEKTPPEKAIYLSVIKKAGLHQKKNGKFSIKLPSKGEDSCHILPAMDCVDQLMRQKLDSKVTVLDMYKHLSAAPYGVKKGLIPLIIALYIKINETDIAIYEEGSFIRRVRDKEFKMMERRPEFYELQLCSVTGVRNELFIELIDMLGVATQKDNPELLDAVTPLCVFGAELSDYVQKTKRLSGHAIKVREAIMKASSPIDLIFTDLPKACGHSPVDSETSHDEVPDFVQDLRNAIVELQKAYISLKDRMEDTICKVFDESGSFQEVRRRLAERAEKCLVTVVEPHLKAFVFRLFDETLPEAAWIESMGAFITSKTPDRWLDNDEDKFHSEFRLIANRFKNAESIAFEQGASKNQIGCRVAVTQASGEETQQVLFHTAGENVEIAKLERELTKLIKKNPRLGAIAASNTICSYLNQEIDND